MIKMKIECDACDGPYHKERSATQSYDCAFDLFKEANTLNQWKSARWRVTMYLPVKAAIKEFRNSRAKTEQELRAYRTHISISS